MTPAARARRPGWAFLRTAIGIGVSGAALVVALVDVFAWLRTGAWQGISLLGLVQRAAGGPALPVWSGPEPLPTIQELIRRLLDAVPASLVALVIGAWLAKRDFPRTDRAAPTSGLWAIDLIKSAATQWKGDDVLAIVSRQRPRLFEYLDEVFRDDQNVRVILDRRWGDRRHRQAARDAERRRRDRRIQPSAGGGSLPEVIVVPQFRAGPDAWRGSGTQGPPRD